MKIWIITMEDPLYTLDFIKNIIKIRYKDIAGITIAKGGRLKIGKKRSKVEYLISLLLIMGLFHFLKNIFVTLTFKIRKKAAGILSFISSPGLAEFANVYNIRVDYTDNPNGDSFLERLKAVSPDVIINQSQFIVKKPLLEVAKIGMLNRHNALLPKNRGRLTPFWVLYKRETSTGVSIHFVEEGIDSGEIVIQKKFPVSKNDTFNTLVKKNYEIASDAMLQALDMLENDHNEFIENNDNYATYNTIPTLKEAFQYRVSLIKRVWKRK